MPGSSTVTPPKRICPDHQRVPVRLFSESLQFYPLAHADGHATNDPSTPEGRV